MLAGRCIPGARSLVSLPAGLLRMPRPKYLLLTLIGSLVWNTVLISIGWALGNNWEQVSEIIGPLSKPLLALAVIGTAAFLWYRGFFSRSTEQAAHTELEGDEEVDAPGREPV